MSRVLASHPGRSQNPKIGGWSPEPVGLKSGRVKPVTLKLTLLLPSLVFCIIRIWQGMLPRHNTMPGRKIPNNQRKVFSLTTPLEHIDFHIMDIKHMGIVIHIFRGNLLSPHRLLFLISCPTRYRLVTMHTPGDHETEPAS